MGNQITNYLVIPNAEEVELVDIDDFIKRIMKGWVDKKGYCPLGGGVGGEGYWDYAFEKNKVKLGRYEKISSSGGWNRNAYNPRFQKLIYHLEGEVEGEVESMIVHIGTVKKNPNLSGLEGLLIEKGKAILVKIK